MSDVLEELGAMLAGVPTSERAPILDVLKRSVGEIVTLREQRATAEHNSWVCIDEIVRLRDMLNSIRADTLEEAAALCDTLAKSGAGGLPPWACKGCAAAIRGLKEPPG